MNTMYCIYEKYDTIYYEKELEKIGRKRYKLLSYTIMLKKHSYKTIDI